VEISNILSFYNAKTEEAMQGKTNVASLVDKILFAIYKILK